MDDVPKYAIPSEQMLPAIGQGAICIEQREGDDLATHLLAAIHHSPTAQRVNAERSFLAALDGSCETPIGGLATLVGDKLRLRGEILREDGSEVLSDDQTVAIEDGPELGKAMALSLLERAGPGFFTHKP
jgi:hydroxymethylbilane synthase